MIHVEDLVKTYHVPIRDPGTLGALRALVAPRTRAVRALDGVSFSIAAGELVAYIGPNGAGKSTTVKVLSGILVPDSGECRVDGRVPWEDRIAHVAKIGVVFGQRTQLWWDLPLDESFRLLRDIYRIPAARFGPQRDRLIEVLGLGEFLDVPVRQLSLGQRMRADLAASLLHEPPVLFLDEPTIGLDARAKLEVRDFVRGLNHDHGTTVILTTHDMDDIEALASRVMVIGRGKLLMDGELSDLWARFGHERRLVVDFEHEIKTFEDPDLRVVRADGRRFELAYDPEVAPTPEVLARLCARYPVRDVTVTETPADEIVAKLYDELERDQE